MLLNALPVVGAWRRSARLAPPPDPAAALAAKNFPAPAAPADKPPAANASGLIIPPCDRAGHAARSTPDRARLGRSRISFSTSIRPASTRRCWRLATPPAASQSTPIALYLSGHSDGRRRGVGQWACAPRFVGRRDSDRRHHGQSTRVFTRRTPRSCRSISSAANLTARKPPPMCRSGNTISSCPSGWDMTLVEYQGRGTKIFWTRFNTSSSGCPASGATFIPRGFPSSRCAPGTISFGGWS